MNEMTNDAAVAWVSEYSLASLLKCRGDEHNGYIHAWMRPDDDYVVPLYSATAVAELRAAVERKSILIEQFMDKWAEEVRRADAAERRVAELEAGAHAVVLAFEALGQSRGIVADRAAHRQCEATLVTLKSLYTLRQEKPE